jgi:hypothetical protein
MKIRVGGLAAIVGAVVLYLAVPAFGQVSMTLTGTNDGVYNNGSDYAGFYQGTIGTQSNVNIICDDYGDNISVGHTWTASMLNAPQIPADLSSTMFGSTIGVVGYAEVATLVEDMFNPATSSAQRDDLSGAIWYITSGGASASLDAGAQADYNAVTAEFSGNIAAADTALYGDTNLWLYTPTGPSGLHSSQEFWSASVPEGGAALLYLLFAGASCFGAMLFSSRNRFGKRETA